jgi:tetratricopeptide (TPR) repeat protein
MGDKMTYRVALDNKEGSEKGKMAETWMEAADQRGIPASFVVDKEARIVWIGHPMELKEAMIEQVLNGTFDIKRAAAEAETKAAKQDKLQKFGRQLNEQVNNKEWDKVESTLTELAAALPESERLQVDMIRFNIALKKQDFDGAAKVAEKLSDAHKDDPRLQNQLAWVLATHKDIKKPDLELASKIATRANEASQGKDPQILDTLARVKFLQGKKEDAVALQEKAVKSAEGDMKDALQKTLDSYKAGKVPSDQE